MSPTRADSVARVQERRVFAAVLILLAVFMTAGAAGAAGARPGASAGPAVPPPGAPIRVVIPDPDNLQYLSFWVALGAGYFADEGLALELSSPPVPAGVLRLLEEENAPVAVLPPPIYLALVADRRPVRVVANLLQHEPINLVVRRSVAQARGLSRAAPLAERLRGLRGLRVGVAPGPVPRLRAMFAAEGMRADEDVTIEIVPGPAQNAAFAEGRVDALFAHTPFLERALVEQDAVLLIHASAGEVAPLAGLQIHTLVVTAAFAEAQPASVLGLTRAIHRAQQLVHADRAAASEAVLRALPALDRRLVEEIVRLYAPAVPDGPRVSAELFARSAALFPVRKPLDGLGPAELAAHVDTSFAEQVMREGAAAAPARGPRRWLWAAGAAVIALGLLLVGVARRRSRGRKRIG